MIEQKTQILVGDSPAFRRAVKAVGMVAPTDATVLLIGGSGSGKEIFAREIHRRSQRASGPFFKVKCAGLTQEGLDTKLNEAFGAALAGTLYLDEVGELPLSAQARLLHLMESETSGPRVRVIVATRRDLWQPVRSGEFREDLYYRLCVVPLELPPLRERVQDIGPLLEHFLAAIAAAHGLEPPSFSATAERQLRRYAWPGNVRELRNFCERMVILFPGHDLGPDNLPWEIRRDAVTAENVVAFKLPSCGIDLCELEVEVIRQALALAGGNKSRAARLLGLTRDTLLYRIRKYALKV